MFCFAITMFRRAITMFCRAITMFRLAIPTFYMSNWEIGMKKHWVIDHKSLMLINNHIDGSINDS